MKNVTSPESNLLIPFQNVDQWDERNNQIHTSLKLPETTSVKVHPGITGSLREVLLGITQMFPHKMTIVFQAKTAHYIEEAMKSFSRQGYKTVALDGTEPPKDTLAVVLANDHPVTGEVYNHTLTTHGFSEKKIFVIRLSHNEHFYRDLNKTVNPFEVAIYNINEKNAVSISGERAKFAAYFSPYLSWNETISLPFNTKKEKKNEIKDFESQLPWGANLFFPKEVHRLYDRSIIYWNDIDGFAIATEMGKDRIGREFEVLSTCRWQNSLVFRPYIRPDISDEAFRGSVIISGDIISQDLKMKLDIAVQKILKLQNG
ncbi:MAG: hypothetical protein A4S09_16495 [Proteobacteria bacterium SG_bin7]|nr:MAG: hypothetical protein A4S09_16495 [Proteobacteria bacterium SG_bin7]